MSTDTIVAIATAPGRGGVGIVRISGAHVISLAKKTLGFAPKPRHAHYCDFLNTAGDVLDTGIALYFPNPHSFTGEDVLELQGHGGPVILDMIVESLLQQGARLARPGEFSERAFLNDKLDLTQAEAIADLIDASSKQAVKQAMNSLKGEFSHHIHDLVEKLTHLRIYVESAIDFPEEEIDFLNDGVIAGQLNTIIEKVEQVLYHAQQGVLVREGMNVVIAGRPNAGKSSLLNQLAEKDIAIVTNIAGTTRDVLRERIHIDGMPLHIIDTAGLRDSPDHVEQIGINRAWAEIDSADRILLMIDSSDTAQLNVEAHWPEFVGNEQLRQKLTVVYNKIDKAHVEPTPSNKYTQLYLSAKIGTGITELKQHLKTVMGYSGTTEGSFSARRRHLDAIESAKQSLLTGKQALEINAAGELLAEDLRLAQERLAEITGTFTADDLLGKIFSSFCIGK